MKLPRWSFGIFDRYILRLYLGAFFYTALIFSLIAVVIDISEKVDRFIEEPVTTRQVIVDYYLNFLLWINFLLWPVFILISVIFFTSKLAYNSEIISVFNAGVPFRRLLKPYLAGAGILMTIHLIGNHYLIPEGNKSRLAFEHKYVWKNEDKAPVDNVHMKLGPGFQAFIKYYRKSDSTALDLRMEQYQNQRLKALWKISSARYNQETGKWKCTDIHTRIFDTLEEQVLRSGGGMLDTTLNMYPSDFILYTNQKDMMNTSELVQFISSEKKRGVVSPRRYIAELWRRSVDSVTILILTLIGVSVAARKVRGGLGWHLALGIGVGAIFNFVSKFALTFASGTNVSPALAVWFPNILFGAIALWMIRRAQQ